MNTHELLTREQMIESIMAICGRGAPRPQHLRDWLNHLSDEVLASEYEKIVEVEEAACN